MKRSLFGLVILLLIDRWYRHGNASFGARGYAGHDKQGVLQIMQGFSKLGVKIYITEMDVDLDLLQCHYPSQAERRNYEAGIYRDMLEACLESGASAIFSAMDISDFMSAVVTSCPMCTWYEPAPNADPDMFDKNFLPKPAYFAVRDVLAGTPTASTPTP